MKCECFKFSRVDNEFTGMDWDASGSLEQFTLAEMMCKRLLKMSNRRVGGRRSRLPVVNRIASAGCERRRMNERAARQDHD